MQLTETIHIIRHEFKIPLTNGKSLDRFVNSFIIFGDSITLIDCGVSGSENKIYEYIRQAGKSIGDIGKLILSHAHPDHIGSACKIKLDTQCEVLSHERERNWIEDIEFQNQQRAIPGFFTLVHESVDIDRTLEDNDIINLSGSLSMRVIHTPGHSPGSLSFLFIEPEILFTADAIPLNNDIPNYDNYWQLIATLRLIKQIKGYNLLLSSWFEPVKGHDNILQLIESGEAYLERINAVVRRNYCRPNIQYLDRCKATIEELGLPTLNINSIVNKAFLSHLA
jgi:glyoxylase-like metal-dependent hydrolase (beta-lactamase superfamily II)